MLVLLLKPVLASNASVASNRRVKLSMNFCVSPPRSSVVLSSNLLTAESKSSSELASPPISSHGLEHIFSCLYEFDEPGPAGALGGVDIFVVETIEGRVVIEDVSPASVEKLCLRICKKLSPPPIGSVDPVFNPRPISEVFEANVLTGVEGAAANETPGVTDVADVAMSGCVVEGVASKRVTVCVPGRASNGVHVDCGDNGAGTADELDTASMLVPRADPAGGWLGVEDVRTCGVGTEIGCRTVELIEGAGRPGVEGAGRLRVEEVEATAGWVGAERDAWPPERATALEYAIAAGELSIFPYIQTLHLDSERETKIT